MTHLIKSKMKSIKKKRMFYHVKVTLKEILPLVVISRNFHIFSIAGFCTAVQSKSFCKLINYNNILLKIFVLFINILGLKNHVLILLQNKVLKELIMINQKFVHSRTLFNLSCKIPLSLA